MFQHIYYTNEGSFFMFHNKFILSFIAVFLVHNSADAMLTKKRPREDGVETRLPKRIKLVCPEAAVATPPQRQYDKMYYCEADVSNCSFVTDRMDKIKEHHALHNAPSAFSCTDCDYLGATTRAVANHVTKWHEQKGPKAKARVVEPVIKKSTTKNCGYCGREGNNMKRHMEVYHTPRFGKRSYFQCFSLYRPVALPTSQSGSGTETE